MRVAVTGRHGQVASALAERAPALGHEIIALGRPELDLAAPPTVFAALRNAAPDLVVSAAAYTAVDKAESEPDLASAINGVGAGAVAAAARALGAPLIHLSTDYVFDGRKTGPYEESDATAPLGVYGASKLLGERMVAAATEDCAILRVAWIYSPFGANFLKTMLQRSEGKDRMRVVADQHGSPTSALDLADAILAVGRNLIGDESPALRGLFHLPAGGAATWADFAERIFETSARLGRPRVAVERIATADYPTPARRPANSLLSGEKLRCAHGVTLPPWEDSVRTCVERLLAR
ncbi:MAG TPA: dTDP-4-dehydrorhamnose reductase [Candidatus Binatia bacterium]|nr:dTDP-4-dehydrorhamnose reductase [Candidatus Binatia bacterium]